MGCMKKPNADRGPNVSIPIMQPQMMITSGARHPVSRTVCGPLSSDVAIGTVHLPVQM
jgi:hypothetical protein